MLREPFVPSAAIVDLLAERRTSCAPRRRLGSLRAYVRTIAKPA